MPEMPLPSSSTEEVGVKMECPWNGFVGETIQEAKSGVIFQTTAGWPSRQKVLRAECEARHFARAGDLDAEQYCTYLRLWFLLHVLRRGLWATDGSSGLCLLLIGRWTWLFDQRSRDFVTEDCQKTERTILRR